MKRLLRISIGATLLIGYGAFLHHHTSFVAGGSDSSGYLNSARLIREGGMTLPVKPLHLLDLDDSYRSAFIPLGFIPGQDVGTMVPSYPPGLPLHMALAALVGGWDSAPFLVVPVLGLGSLLLIGFLGRQLGLPPGYCFGVAAILAAYPVFIFQATQAMSDVPATFWSLASITAAVQSRRRPIWAVVSGAAFGIAVLVRPTNLLLVVPLVFALPLTRTVLGFCIAGLLPPAAFFLAYNSAAYGSATNTGYGPLFGGGGLAVGFFPDRFRHYSYWLVTLLSPLVPLGWLAATVNRRLTAKVRGLLIAWFSVFLLFYCFYLPYETWWYARFLLPGTAALVLAAALTARDVLGPPERRGEGAGQDWWLRGYAAPILLLVAVLWAEVSFVTQNRIHKNYKGDLVYPSACRFAERRVSKGIVASMQLSGALLYYTDLPFARWDAISSQDWPRIREQARKNGYKWYALIAPFETEEMRRHMPGDWREAGTSRGIILWELAEKEHTGSVSEGLPR